MRAITLACTGSFDWPVWTTISDIIVKHNFWRVGKMSLYKKILLKKSFNFRNFWKIFKLQKIFTIRNISNTVFPTLKDILRNVLVLWKSQTWNKKLFWCLHFLHHFWKISKFEKTHFLAYPWIPEYAIFPTLLLGHYRDRSIADRGDLRPHFWYNLHCWDPNRRPSKNDDTLYPRHQFGPHALKIYVSNSRYYSSAVW